MKRLGQTTLDQLAATAMVSVPKYDRAASRVSIVHLGIGAFHRAHQAVYSDDLLAAGARDCAIVGVSLRSTATRDALLPQDCLYTVAERDGGRDHLRVIGSVKQILVASDDADAVVARMCDPTVKVVSLTVTEKGYCHHPATGRLDFQHEDIVHDLGNPATPRSAPGYLVAALARRRRQGQPPFTVLCCDNLPHNGALLRTVVREYAQALDSGLAGWIDEHAAFPSTMVDRIVPATTADDTEVVSRALGVADAWPVICEPFRQWVIEDRFVDERPRWELVGAELVADVAPWELMKLRLLNGSHSALAYLGYLGGYRTIAEVMANPDYVRFVSSMMDEEIGPTLSVPTGADLADYQQQLLARFANTGIRHRTWQIAMDGSQKLPQRLLGTIRDRLAAKAPVALTTLAVAGWIRYISAVDEQGVAIDVQDPLAALLRERIERAGADPAEMVRAVTAVEAVFGDDLGSQRAFTEPLTRALRNLQQFGAARTVAAWPGRAQP